jgi:hypothetical protein
MQNQSTQTISQVKIPSTSPERLVDSIDEFESSFFNFLSHRWPHLLDLDSPYESSFINTTVSSAQPNEELRPNLDAQSPGCILSNWLEPLTLKNLLIK